jgi:hypothetical protein
VKLAFNVNTVREAVTDCRQPGTNAIETQEPSKGKCILVAMESVENGKG